MAALANAGAMAPPGIPQKNDANTAHRKTMDSKDRVMGTLLRRKDSAARWSRKIPRWSSPYRLSRLRQRFLEIRLSDLTRGDISSYTEIKRE